MKTMSATLSPSHRTDAPRQTFISTQRAATAAHGRRSKTAADRTAVEVGVLSRLVQQLIRSRHGERKAARAKLLGYLRYFGPCEVDAALFEMLMACVTKGGPDGLDAATDVLAALGPQTAGFARWLLNSDYRRWASASPGRAMDDVWYAVLRGLCQSDAEFVDQVGVLITAARFGTASIREAAAHAVGDLLERRPDQIDGGRGLLTEMAANDPCPAVRETATEEIDDLEG